MPREDQVSGLCGAVQPDGSGQRCIRFSGHEGLHQTFVAEWREGDLGSRRRQRPADVRKPGGKSDKKGPHRKHAVSRGRRS